MSKGAPTKTVKELLSEVQEIDPLGVIVITSAGIAGACGIRGPLTTLVAGISSALAPGGSVNSAAGSAVNIQELAFTPVLVWEGIDYLSKAFSGDSLANMSNLGFPSPYANANDTQKQQLVAIVGNAAGNMVEAGLMYTLFKNPETLKTIFDIGRESAKAGISGAKAAAALL